MTCLVDEKRVESRVVGLIAEKPRTTKEGNAEYMQIDRDIQRLKRTDPRLWRNLVFNLVRALSAIDQARTREVQEEIDRFNDSFRVKT